MGAGRRLHHCDIWNYNELTKWGCETISKNRDLHFRRR